MRNVIELGGNATDKLWGMMGHQTDSHGLERHGQSCFLYVHPVGTTETRKLIEGMPATQPFDNDVGEPSGPIDLVAQEVLTASVLCTNFVDDTDAILQYDGFRVGAGWIYAALLVAKAHGCTQASVGIQSNDGNLSMEAWDTTLGSYVHAVHITYYGT